MKDGKEKGVFFSTNVISAVIPGSSNRLPSFASISFRVLHGIDFAINARTISPMILDWLDWMLITQSYKFLLAV